MLQMKISLVVNRSLQQEQCQVIVAAKFNPASWRFTAQCNCSRNTRSIFIISNTNDGQLVAFVDQVDCKLWVDPKNGYEIAPRHFKWDRFAF